MKYFRIYIHKCDVPQYQLILLLVLVQHLYIRRIFLWSYLPLYIYIYIFRDFGQTQSTTEETIDIIMLIPSNNNMITILGIKIQKTIKLLKYLQKRDIL